MPQHQPSTFLPNPNNKKLISDLEAHLKRPGRSLRNVYQIGCILRKLQAEVGKYGSQWLNNVVDDLDRPSDRTFLYRAIRIAKYYSRQEIEELNSTLSWGKAAMLAKVSNKKTHMRLRTAAIEKNWSDRNLRMNIDQRNGCRPRSGRRPREFRYYGPAMALRTMTRLSKDWLACYKSVWSKVISDFRRLSDKRREDLTILLGDAQKVLNEMKVAMKSLSGDLDDLCH